jgi:hypothetical protein
MSTNTSSADDSTVSWQSGRTSDGQPVERKIGDTAHDGADAVYDRDAHKYDRADPSAYQQPKDYDGDGSMGSHFTRSDVEKHVSDPEKRRQFKRMDMWNQRLNPSYEDPEGDKNGESVVQPSDDTGRRGLRDKLNAVELVCDELDVPPAVRAEARTLVASADGRGHCIEKVSLGAVLVAHDRFLRNKVVRADVDGPLSEATERLQTAESDREIDTILNVLEGTDALEGVFARRMKRWDDVEELADCNGFKLNHAKAVHYSDE